MTREPSHFSYLEVDDGPTRAELESRRAQEEHEVEIAREAAATRATEQAAAHRRAAEAAHEEAEAIERRNEASMTRVERKKMLARDKRSRMSAKKRANDALYDFNKKYHKGSDSAINHIQALVEQEGFIIGEITHHSTGRFTYALDLDGKEHWLHVSTYQMPSGNWEFVASVE